MLDDGLDVREKIIVLVFQKQVEQFAPGAITWSCNADGLQYSPKIICEFYKRDLKTVHEEFMEDPNALIDRHKIIALTQKIILDLQPLDFKDSQKSADERYGLNVDFAFRFGFHFLVRWNEVYYPEQHFDNPANIFPTPLFLFRLNRTKAGKALLLEHRKWLMAKKTGNIFSLFLLSQFWFLLEQWCLEYMRHQRNAPLEKPENDG